jgi:hypothetical protein
LLFNSTCENCRTFSFPKIQGGLAVATCHIEQCQPPGFFAAYSKAEIQEENRLAKSSVIRAPKDLE